MCKFTRVNLKTRAELVSPNPFRWLVLIAIDWAVVCVVIFIALTMQSLALFWLASLVIGNRQHAIAFMAHDAAHGTASKNKKLNDILGSIFAFWPIGAGLFAYRDFHFKHHRHVGTSLDPELKHKHWARPQYLPPLRFKKFAVYIFKDLLGFAVVDFFRLIRLIPPVHYLDVVGPLVLNGLFIFVCYRVAHIEVALLWYFSLISSFWASFRVRIWIEHVGTSETHRVDLPGWFSLLFAPHWSSYHYEHHRWPSIPCWNLPKARLLDTQQPILSLSQLVQNLSSGK